MNEPVRPSALALSPLLVFLALFFGAGLYFTSHGETMGFYQLRAPVAILPALGLAAFIAWRRGLKPLETLLGAAQMLDHLGKPDQATRLRDAIVATLEAKDSLTPDLGGTGNTMSFAKAIAGRI